MDCCSVVVATVPHCSGLFTHKYEDLICNNNFKYFHWLLTTVTVQKLY